MFSLKFGLNILDSYAHHCLATYSDFIFNSDVAKFEAGIGDKLGLFCQHSSTFITGVSIGFTFSWQLTLVILAFSPLLVLAGLLLAKVLYGR